MSLIISSMFTAFPYGPNGSKREIYLSVRSTTSHCLPFSHGLPIIYSSICHSCPCICLDYKTKPQVTTSLFASTAQRYTFAKSNCRRLYFSHTLAYMFLFSGTNKINRGEGKFVSCKDYASGYSLHVYDLSVDLDENDHFNLIRWKTYRFQQRQRRQCYDRR